MQRGPITFLLYQGEKKLTPKKQKEATQESVLKNNPQRGYFNIVRKLDHFELSRAGCISTFIDSFSFSYPGNWILPFIT